MLDLAAMRAAASGATAMLRTLANEDRLLLLCQLSQGELSVGELEALVGVHQPTLSQQLGVLRAQGLVRTRRDGKRVFYAVADGRALAVLDTLYALYCPTGKGAGDHLADRATPDDLDEHHDHDH